VLLEVLIALTILALASYSALTTIADVMIGDRNWRKRERQIMEADKLLTAAVLMSAKDLDIRLGDRDRGPYVMNIQRPEPGLYRVVVRDSSAPQTDLLVTVVYRPEPELEIRR